MIKTGNFRLFFGRKFPVLINATKEKGDAMPLPRNLERKRLGDLALLVLVDLMKTHEGMFPDNLVFRQLEATAGRMGVTGKELERFADDLFHLMSDGEWRGKDGTLERVT